MKISECEIWFYSESEKNEKKILNANEMCIQVLQVARL